jgi:hypothetical protein
MRPIMILRAAIPLALAALLATASDAGAIDVTPHRAVYEMSLAKAQPASGITGAQGRMEFEWSDSCDGWVVQQRYNLRMTYEESGDVAISINFVTWESKDGLRYRYNVRKLRDGLPDEDLKGEAALSASDKGGEARFTRPDNQTIPLASGTLFPTGHTIAMVKAALEGESFVPKQVFDGGTLAGADQVTAAIGKSQPADAGDPDPLLRKHWWPVRMAFFAADSNDAASPDYELGMDLQEDGIARNMTLDYGTFNVRAKLEKVEKLPPPRC